MTTSQLLRAATGPAILAALVCDAVAHPGHSHRKPSAQVADAASSGNERTWTAASGAFHLHGSFVTANAADVQIRRADESLIRVKLSQLTESDQVWIGRRLAQIRLANETAVRGTNAVLLPISHDIEDQPAMNVNAASQLPLLLAQLDRNQSRADSTAKTPDIARAFDAFVKLNAIKTRWDDRFFYVESNGIPDHRMMVGITAWQQQVPIPQKYFGDNAWQIPLHPVPAKNPQSAKGRFLRGAIALAANGIPIFNPLNNRGDDAYLFGELDEFGGHCGRADDYHYHLAPVHLAKTVGKGLPIAYALDGYPIYGYEEPDGSKVVGLDAFNGHKDKQGNYHYHATRKYPYLNGGFYGEVTERDSQVDPQPRAEPLRPALPPLRDARITDFVETKPGSFRLTYEVRGKKGTVSYSLAADGSAKFTFVDTDGTTSNETYAPQRGGRGGRDRRPPPPRDDRRPPPRDDRGPPPRKADRP